MPSILPPGPWQQNGRWIVRRLWALTRRPPHIPAIALFHHHLPSVPQLWGLLKVHYWLKATALQNVWREIGVPSAALSLLMSCVWERQVVAGAALCIPRAAECPPCCPARPLPFPEPPPGPLPPCCSDESQAGFSTSWVYWAVLQENTAQTAPLQPKRSVIFNSSCHLIRYIARVTAKNLNDKKTPTAKARVRCFHNSCSEFNINIKAAKDSLTKHMWLGAIYNKVTCRMVSIGT